MVVDHHDLHLFGLHVFKILTPARPAMVVRVAKFADFVVRLVPTEYPWLIARYTKRLLGENG